MSNERHIFRLSFLFIISCLIVFNFLIQLPRFIDCVRILKNHQVRSVGRVFRPLIPYLRRVPWIGYTTCLESSHPLTDALVMGPYQQAQFVLSPTILDYDHPLDYPFIILQCPDGKDQSQIRRKLAAYVDVKSFHGVSLLYRREPPR